MENTGFTCIPLVKTGEPYVPAMRWSQSKPGKVNLDLGNVNVNQEYVKPIRKGKVESLSLGKEVVNLEQADLSLGEVI